jgi:hypothetical protein
MAIFANNFTIPQTLLGMGYINVNSIHGKTRIHVDGEMWIFAVLSVVFLVLTLGSYWAWSRRCQTGKEDQELALV